MLWQKCIFLEIYRRKRLNMKVGTLQVQAKIIRLCWTLFIDVQYIFFLDIAS